MAQWVDICVAWRRAGCDWKLGQMDFNGIKPIVTIKHGKVHFHWAPPSDPWVSVWLAQDTIGQGWGMVSLLFPLYPVSLHSERILLHLSVETWLSSRFLSTQATCFFCSCLSRFWVLNIQCEGLSHEFYSSIVLKEPHYLFCAEFQLLTLSCFDRNVSKTT